MPVVSDNIGIKVTSTGDTSGIDKTSASLKGLASGTDQANSSVSTFGATFKAILASQVVTQLASGLRDMATTAVTSAGSYEQSRIAFETMLGSADKARSMLEDISKFARETPFELPEVVQGTKQLLAFGIAQEDLLPTMRMLGDVASGVSVPVGQIAYAYGQVKVAGKLMATELLQFTNAGVPMLENLSKVLKKPQQDIRKLIEEGKVGFPEVEQAFKLMTGEGGKFGGMMEKQSKSFNGVVSNIKDGFGQMLRAAVGVTPAGDIVAGGVFDRIKNVALKTMPTIQEWSQEVGPLMSRAMEKTGEIAKDFKGVLERVWDYIGPKFSAVAKTLTTELIPALKDFWDKAIVPMLPVIGVALVGALGLAMDAFNGLLNMVTPVVNFLADNSWVFWSIVTVFGAIRTALFLQGALAAFMGVMAGVQASGIATATVVSGAFTTMKGILMTIAAPGVGTAALAAAAIVGAGIVITNKWKETTDTINKTKNAIADAGASADIVNGKLLNLIRTGDKAQQIRAYDTLTKMGQGAAANRALGISGSYASGGYTGPGGENQVAGVVHKGEYVVPKSQVDQSTGLPKVSNSSVNIYQTNNIHNDIDMKQANVELGWRLANA